MSEREQLVSGVFEADPMAGRRWSRFKIDVRLKLKVNNNGVTTAVFGQGTDISEGGVSAYLAIGLRLGKRVDLELTLPYAQQPIKVVAIVRNQRGYWYGMEFENLSPSDLELISRTCKALSLVQ